MKFLNTAGCALLMLGILGFLASAIVPSQMASKGRLIQRIKPYDKDVASLTDEIGETIGSPQVMIIDDAKAFLPGSGESGAKLVNDDYLKAHSIYPLQVKTVRYVGGLARIGTGAMALVGLVLFGWTRRKLKKSDRDVFPTVYTISPCA
jgi:hypothetical protein